MKLCLDFSSSLPSTSIEQESKDPGGEHPPITQNKSRIVTGVAKVLVYRSPVNFWISFISKSPSGSVAPFLDTPSWKLRLKAHHSFRAPKNPRADPARHLPSPAPQQAHEGDGRTSPPGRRAEAEQSPPCPQALGAVLRRGASISGMQSVHRPLTPPNSVHFPSSHSTEVQTLGPSSDAWVFPTHFSTSP